MVSICKTSVSARRRAMRKSLVRRLRISSPEKPKDGSAISTAQTKYDRGCEGRTALDFRLPRTILVDHRLPEFRPVDLMR
jgi:hypothetical protein